MDWQARRKFTYAFAVIITIFAVSVYLLRDILFPVPTCFDKKQNGYELGIDCGGVCAPRCASEVEPLSVLWTRLIKTSATTYDLVAMVSNKNINNSSRGVSYFFNVYNDKGEVIDKITGDTVTPVSGDFPIIKQSVKLSQTPYEVTLNIIDGIHYPVNEKPTSPTLKVVNEHFENGDIPRVYATVVNMKRISIDNLPIRVILFDQNNNAYAVGETVIPSLGKEEVKGITFTWDYRLPLPPTRIRVYPIFDPFLSIE